MPSDDPTDAGPSIAVMSDQMSSDFLQTIIEDTRTIDCDVIRDALAARMTADEAQFGTSIGAAKLLTAICGLHFRLHDRAETFGAMVVFEDGRRSPIPADWKGLQSEEIARAAADIRNPGLRARMADVAWVNDRRDHRSAALAVDAYCEAAELLGDGTFSDRFESPARPGRTEVDLVERAVQIAHATNRRKALPDRVVDNLHRLRAVSVEEAEPFSLERVGRTLIAFELILPRDLVSDVENVANIYSNSDDAYPQATKDLWLLAADLRRRAGDGERELRCRVNAAEQTLEMRHGASGSAGAAHWVKAAISELRKLAGTEDRVTELKVELRELQARSLQEMQTFEYEIPGIEQRERIFDAISQMNVSEALRALLTIHRPPEAEALRREVLDPEQQGLIHQLVGTEQLDDEGKVITVSPAANFRGEQTEEWIRARISANLGFYRQYAVATAISAARAAIALSHSIDEDHMIAIVTSSPFVPHDMRAIAALGLTRYLQGDLISAVHLLIPLAESGVRWLLQSAGVETSKIDNDGVQSDRSLSKLLSEFAEPLRGIVGPDLLMHLEMIFVGRPGPALRHEMAHGKISAADCYGPDAIYACWFIFLLIAKPLLRDWEELVVKPLRAMGREKREKDGRR